MCDVRLWLALVLWQAAQEAAGVGDNFDTDSSLSKSVILKDGDEFEYVVVGAGGAGAACGARLAHSAGRVLLADAGPDPGPVSTVPGLALGLQGSHLDWQYDTVPNNVSCLSSRNQQCRISSGRCLGGSTSINAMIYTRGTPTDYDELSIPGWTWSDIKPYFLRYENFRDLSKLPPSSTPYHNTSGTMRLQFFTNSKNPWHSRVIKGYESLNIPFNPDVNAASQIGVTKVIGYVYNNIRMSTARAYLTRSDVKKRLKVAKLTRCVGVIIGKDKVARGIQVVQGVSQKKIRIYATKEVILSAGAIGTPQILMLSGIGHKKHLEDLNIKVRADLPVGDDMADHVFPLIFVKVDRGIGIAKKLIDASRKVLDFTELLLTRNGPLASNGLTDICTFINTLCYDFKKRKLIGGKNCSLPSVQYIHAYIDRGLIAVGASLFQRSADLNDAVTNQLKDISKDYALLVKSPLVLQPLSRGTIRLASVDPLAYPAIKPNYLSDDRDLKEMLRSIAILEHLMETEPYLSQNATIVHLDLKGCPKYEDNKWEYWECYCRHLTHTTYHAVGTTALGRVVDTQLRVLGVKNLRVADLGVLPRLPRGNTAAIAIAIGERVADFILSEP